MTATKKNGTKKGSKTCGFGTGSRISHDSSQYYNSRLYAGIKPANDGSPAMDNPFPPEWENRIIPASSEKMKELPDNCLHLMVTSPPYNVTKEYDDDLSLQEYLELLATGVHRDLPRAGGWRAGLRQRGQPGAQALHPAF